MKKLYIGLIGGLMAGMLLGCGSKNGNGNPASDSSREVVEETGSANGEIVTNGKPSVIDFYADWCGPCRQIAPLFHELESQLGETVNFYRVNVDEDRVTAMKYQIEAMPTFIFLDKEGKEIDRLVGADPEALKQKVESLRQ